MVQLGFVFVRQAAAPRFEAFYNQIVSGLQDGLAGHGGTLVIAQVEGPAQELSTYEHWCRTNAVDAVIVKDLLDVEDRLVRLEAIGMPFIALGDTGQGGVFSAVRTDNGLAMRDCIEFLTALGHRFIARVAGPAALAHTGVRTRVFEAEAEAAGMRHLVVAGDYSEQSGQTATSALLTGVDRPTAIVYDNDLMAIGGLIAAKSHGVDVPGAVSLLAWDDSVLCQLTSPPLSALSHDVHQIGLQLAEQAMIMLEHGMVVTALAARPVIIERGTTARVVPAEVSLASDLGVGA